jgi:hypothetical protein
MTTALDVDARTATITAVVNVSSNGQEAVTVEYSVLDASGRSVATATQVWVDQYCSDSTKCTALDVEEHGEQRRSSDSSATY